MILETLICSTNFNEEVNVAPFGIQKKKDIVVISPYLPSKTHENLLQNKFATVNHTDDAGLFVNCFLKKKKFKLAKCQLIDSFFLKDALSYHEIEVIDYKKDKLRPSFFCKSLFFKNSAPFLGFNRARNALLEACILASRIKILKKDKIDQELNYLSTAIEKTSGPKEISLWRDINIFIVNEMKKYGKN
tara:strand:+ start:103 stop:669 length:567 start_codon:yes stop_codon:yes gene_type:complete